MELKNILIDSVDKLNDIYGLPTVNPLVTVFDLNHATRPPLSFARVTYGLYVVFLKNLPNCSLLYGRHSYDFKAGTVVSLSPGQTVGVLEPAVKTASRDVRGIAFHPDLIYGTPLADKIAAFSFFDFADLEALLLSDGERAVVIDCLDKIKGEMQHVADRHSQTILTANIYLLLEYLHRFYDRQFQTRHKANSNVVHRFEQSLRAYFTYCDRGYPTVGYFAAEAGLSPGYFGELVKRETGITAKDIIARRVVQVAKQKLLATSSDIAHIAYEMGFEYPAHFSRLFKRICGESPTEFRRHAGKRQ